MPEMPIFRRFFAMQAFKPLSDAAFAGSGTAKTLPKVAMETNFGPLILEIDIVAAPVTAANFLRYVDAGAYNGGQFHRTVTPDNQPDNEIRIGVIQGSMRNGAAEYAPIPLERTTRTGITHLNGVISMARTEADTATNQFFSLCWRPAGAGLRRARGTRMDRASRRLDGWWKAGWC